MQALIKIPLFLTNWLFGRMPMKCRLASANCYVASGQLSQVLHWWAMVTWSDTCSWVLKMSCTSELLLLGRSVIRLTASIDVTQICLISQVVLFLGWFLVSWGSVIGRHIRSRAAREWTRMKSHTSTRLLGMIAVCSKCRVLAALTHFK